MNLFTNFKFLPWLALTVSIFVTTLLWIYFEDLQSENERLEHDITAETIQNSVEDKLLEYRALLSGGKGLFAVSNIVVPKDWTEFVRVQNIQERFPGIQGFGFIKHVGSDEDLVSLTQFMKSHGVTDFNVKPEGKREKYYPIIYLWPQNNENARTIGYDIYSEQIRKAAVDLSESSGHTAITSKIILVSESGKDIQSGFLMIQPIYEKGKLIETESERKDSIVGFVYAPFRINDFMKATIDPLQLGKIRFEIYDGEDKPKNLFFASDSISGTHNDGQRIKTSTMTFGGKTWTIVFYDLQLHDAGRYLVSVSILIGGFTTSILLFFIFYFINKNNALIQEKIKTEKFAALGEFTARLSHDLRNPLTVIKNSADLIKMNLPVRDETTLRQFDIIQRSISKINNQINSTMNYVRTKPLSLSKESLLKLINLSITDSLHADNIRIISPKNDAEIECDKDQLLIVFNNLIQNSIQVLEGEGGTITILISDKDDRVLVDISDTGKGIPQNILSKIFEPLFTTKRMGTGLGLASCKNIIEQHKGTITVKNNPTTFSINLPKRQITALNYGNQTNWTNLLDNNRNI